MVAKTISVVLALGTINKICLKSLPRTTTFPPKGLCKLSSIKKHIISLSVLSRASNVNLLIIGALSHMIKVVCLKNAAFKLSCLIEQQESSFNNNGIAN